MALKKFARKISKALKKAGPVGELLGAGAIGAGLKGAGPAAATLGLGKIGGKLFRGRSRQAEASAPQPGPATPAAAAPEDNRAGMAGTAVGLKRGGAVKKDMMGRAMKKTGADAMGRAMAKKPAAKKPAAKKMMGGGMMKGYKSGGMAKKSGRSC